MKSVRRVGMSLAGAAAAAVLVVIPGGALGASHASQSLILGSEGTNITQLNPALRVASFDQVLYPLLWDSLVTTTKTGGLAPDLALSWSHSADLKTWTFTLRKGVKYIDGSTLDATSVINAFKYYLDPLTASNYRAKIIDISDMTAVNPYSVRFTLSAPNAVFPYTVDQIEIIDTSNVPNINSSPNTSGPFRVVSFVPNDTLVLQRNTHYWGKAPKLQQITIEKFADEPTAISALRGGQADAVYNISYANLPQINSAGSGLTAVIAKPFYYAQNWMVDTTAPPFNNPKARQALSYATNREAILKVAYDGLGAIATANDPVPVFLPYYAKKAVTKYTYNLDKAKQLFAEAGVNAGDTITWLGIAGHQTERIVAAQILQQSLAKIGIKLNIDLVAATEFIARLTPPGKSFPDTIAPFGAEVQTPLEPYAVFHPYVHAYCYCNWTYPSLESNYSGNLGIGTLQARQAASVKMQQMISTQVPVIIPLLTSLLTGARTDAKGIWTNYGGTFLHLEDAYMSGS
jgi:peptide/nickel transport system substrate-binding protein